MKRIDQVSNYSSFIKERDKALERLHQIAQQKQSDIMRALLSTTLNVIKLHYHNLIDPSKPHEIEATSRSLANFYHFSAAEFTRIVLDLRRSTYVLAHAGESEAIARVLDKKINVTLNKSQIQDKTKGASVAGGPIEHRIKLYLDRLRYKILTNVQMVAMTRDEDNQPLPLEQMLKRVLQAMPQARSVKVPRRILRPKLLEAKISPGVSAAIDAGIDEETWNRMVDAYMTEFVPRWRGPEFVIDSALGEADPNAWYAWEFERDLTNEFIQTVRDGEIDAANSAGITDFVWVAIVDNKTCDDCCDGSGCIDRDGLLTSEIEKQFGDPVNPPAHFNCRCRLAPALDSIPEKTAVDYKSFDEWLNT